MDIVINDKMECDIGLVRQFTCIFEVREYILSRVYKVLIGGPTTYYVRFMVFVHAGSSADDWILKKAVC